MAGAVWEYADAASDPTAAETNLDYPVLPAFCLGLFGLVAANRLTTGTARAGEVLEAAPVRRRDRTLALCAAALLPGLVALAGSLVELARWQVDPPVHSVGWGEFTDVELVAILGAGVVAAVGGPLVGVLVGRWWRWPLASAVVTVALVLWSVASLVADHGVLLRLNHVAAPFTLVAANGSTSSWHLGGDLVWRLVYLVGLCALAVVGACAQGSAGEERRRLVRVTAVVAAATVAALALAVLLGPAGYPGHWDPRWT